MPTSSSNVRSEGAPEELWSSRDDLVYALGRRPNGKLLLGTGNQGAVLELEGSHIFSRLVRTASGQVTSIASGPGGKLFLAAANPGKILTLGPDNEPEGSYESQPFDARGNRFIVPAVRPLIFQRIKNGIDEIGQALGNGTRSG